VGFVTGHDVSAEQVKVAVVTIPDDIELARAGDRGALYRILRAMADVVYPIAVCMLASPCEAECATREILIRLVTALGSFDGDRSLCVWMYRVATDHLLTTRELRATRFDALAAPCALADELHLLITNRRPS
jgi:DNA-directed RNA polymerase specialized sigma24 family protein